MKFKYTAKTKQGELQTGLVEGPNREGAFSILSGHELVILSLESAEVPRFYERFLELFKRVGRSDLMIFTRQFATLLDAKISIGDSLKNLYKQTRNPSLKEVISEVASDVDSGLTLSQALGRHQNIFSEFFVSMVRSAEITGRLDEVIGFLADYLEKEVGLLSRVRNAMIYPFVVIALFGVVVTVMITFVFPQLKPVFEEANVELPLITKILLGGGEFMLKWWPAVIVVALVLIFFVVDYLRSQEGKIVMDELRLRLPGIGGLYRKVYIARFAESASVLIKGGIPIAQALEISGHNIGSMIYQEALQKVAGAVREGQLVSQALSEQEYYFPPLVSQMIGVGESTGKLDALLARIASFYTREVDDAVSRLVELIQPALMVVIGLLVGLLFVAVLVPIYNLTKVF